ncbi:Asx homology domain-containing protein [Xylaria bambusicola]|uniref:Asx homology domain-containing protein n=1 Tax=Xylaria bambusicola TaxID=326684 RepID=UPI002007F11E|nr:Asx homology domain-containing protein [Xylaria bambusicola]KAI0525345.1 Asx homology domain-containing protein [Xylaria bambusicola]
MESNRIRNRSITSANARLSDERDTPAKAQDAEQPTSDKEVVLDEIIVSQSPSVQRTSTAVLPNDHVDEGTMEASTPLVRRSKRFSSSSQRIASSALSDKSVTVKKQESGISINGDGESDEVSLSSASKRRRLNHESSPHVASRKSRSKWDNPDDMLTDPKSPLVNAKLRELLCSPMVWDILTDEEKEQILSKFPNNSMILNPDTPQARPNVSALLNNNNFRNDVTQYQEGLGKGYHDPDWIREAQAAHRARVAGLYDDFVAADFEEKWDMPIPGRPHDDTGVNEGNRHRAVSASDSTIVPEDAKNNNPETNDKMEL